MDIYRPICRHLVIPLWARWERTPYLKHLQFLESSQYFEPEKIRDMQWQRASSLIRHAYENCAFYRKKYQELGLHPEDIRSFEEFDKIPVLTKDEVCRHKEEIMAPGVDHYYSFLTSGSTGRPLSGHWNKECSEHKRACQRRSELWTGYRLGERIYCLYGDPEKEKSGLKKFRAKVRRKYLMRTEILDMLALTDQSMGRFAEKMLRNPPSLLWGHTHGLYLLARFLEREGITGIRPKGIFSAGMVVHSFEREQVEKVFQCPLQNRYGCEELGLIAAECKELKGLHINTDSHYIEYLKADGSHAGPGENGVIVVTDLWNLAMPFIRYRLGDVCVPTDTRCPCGRTQPLIRRIEGRVADFIQTPDGRLVSGISLTDHFAGHIPGVEQVQIVQEELDLLTLNLVKAGGFNEKTMEILSRMISDFFGKAMRFRCNFVDNIPQEPSGKFRFTISKLDHELF